MWPKGLFTQRASGWAYLQAECFSSGSLLFWGAKRNHDLKTTLPLHPQIPKELSLPTLGILSLEFLFLDCYVASLGGSPPSNTHHQGKERLKRCKLKTSDTENSFSSRTQNTLYMWLLSGCKKTPKLSLICLYYRYNTYDI